MNIALVVTTLGRVEALRTLLTSLEGQLAQQDRIVLVAQSNHDEVSAVAEQFVTRGVPVVATRSERGASLGRNTGVAALPSGEFVINFPNDTTVFPAGMMDRIRVGVRGPSFVAGAFTSWDERGPKTQLPPAGTPMDRWNVWAVIEIGILMRRSLFEEIGGFDEAIGPGASTPWQVAEGTDLLLRAVRDRPDVAHGFTWLPHGVYVEGISTAFGLTTRERRRKMRAYGRGTGRMIAVHRYPMWWRAAFTLAGLFYGFRNAAPVTIADGWSMFAGRLEGAIGRTFGQHQLVSTTR
ncbi:glycosyltransferase family A protein [Microbacterium sp.]|uniref:glycosyltransferase family 2 protein n=1 Tax=Microbacterium sp. TaxID=51671 RepID=UPI0025EEF6A4|nr:glycosyltransferase family A protein [Microbacterium sp.]